MRELFKALWIAAPPVPAFLTFWFAPSRESIHVRVPDLDQLDDDDVAELQARGENVYFGLGARDADLGPKRQGGVKNISAVPAVALDVDFFNPDHPDAHKAQNLPRDLEEFAAACMDGVPDPSALVMTGNGAHLYWFFSEPVILASATERKQLYRAFKDFQKPLIASAKKAGWQLDSTSQIQRVWRVPGFVNQKTGRPVELEACVTSRRYRLGDLGMKLPKRRETKKKRRLATDLVENVRAALRRLAMPNQKHRWREEILAVLDGRSMAPPGERDVTLQAICSIIAWLPISRGALAADLAEVLRPSLEVWADEERADKTIDEEIEKAIDKIARSQEDYKAKLEDRREELSGIARGLKLGEMATTEQLEKHAIIQYGSVYYVYDFARQRYSPPKIQAELLTYARDAWADSPLDLNYVNARGELKVKTVETVKAEYATAADRVEARLALQESYFDPDDLVFYEACCPLRVTEAERDPRIEEWMEAAVGEKADKLADWAAVLPRLDEQCCATYLDGKSGAGKGMFAHGSARLWHTGPPTLFENLISENTPFNAELAKCPLAWIDEGLGATRRDVTKAFRAIVGQQSFWLNEKGIPRRPVVGAIRLIICANNDAVLTGGISDLGVEDLEAVVWRILHIKVLESGARWMEEKNKDKALTREWVEGDGLARHILWLAENRDVVPGRRFLVEGDMTSMHRSMVMNGNAEGLIFEWLVKFGSNPDAIYRRYKGKNAAPMAYIGNGEIMVRTECLVDHWDAYMSKSEARKPSSRVMGKVLARLAVGQKKVGVRGEKRHMFWKLKSDLVIEWSKANQIGDVETIVKNLGDKP